MMSEKFDYDLIIIGSGAAGMSAARAAAGSLRRFMGIVLSVGA